ncbi:PAS domain S-box protein [Carboxydothermus ferrireducens]|uniref:Stage 0 sporulation protein A homolog n=1 Tax=Carboxydothermus ferrireducens DSM 11255 TaxID=1119529 RepID=A0ABX2R9F7_9THEO|nr:PAS domain S-box protein [Carboxydothermus ferrireducens]NYE56728.1 diguanylate cyclase (GGDEF)-like protein/PAS domain S-box-containing protein [Carboxydothermus ferrireducens DSM 11255]
MNEVMPKKILIVEDSRLNAQITADILNKYGYETEIVRQGEEAVEKAKSGQNPALILMDIELMGKLDGIETARIIQQFKDIPVIFLTANTNKEIMEKIKSVTGYGYILKGVGEYVLISTVEMALKLHEANMMVKQSEELFRNMFETNEAIMLLIEPKSGRIVDANKSACRFYGYPKETLVEMDIGKINITSVINNDKNCIETFKRSYNPCICIQRLANGEKRFVEIYSTVVNYQKKELLYLIIFDITERWYAEKELKFYHHLFENSPNEMYIFHSKTLKFISANRRARENLGYSLEELKEMTPLDLKLEFDMQSFKELLAPLYEGEKEIIIFNTIHRRKDGSTYPVEVRLLLIESAKGKVYMAIVIDVTKQKTLERELQERNEILSTIMKSAGDAIIMIDNKGEVTFWNPAAERIFGYTKEEVMGKELHRFMIHDERLYQLYKEAFKKFQLSGRGSAAGKTIELKTKHKEGHEIDIELSLSAVRIRDAWHAVGIVRDVTERKKIEELLYQQSITDPLTNVYNRRFFMQMLEQEMERTRRNGKPFSVIMFDIDHFKSVNDHFGHAAGDMVLKNIADMVKKRIRKTDCFARWGGEEFIILLPETSIKDAVGLAEELRERLISMTLPEVGHATASFGVASYRPSDTIDTILLRADDMLYEAKASGRNCVKSE